MRRFQKYRAFTLVELLAAVAIIGILGGILFTALGSARQSAQQAACLSNMRQLAGAVHLHCTEHGGEFPRSNHSAFGYGERNWLWEIQPYLAADEPQNTAEFNDVMARHCRCPMDERESGSSYGLNVYFEVAQNERQFDEYREAPQNWRTLARIRQPESTILLAELKTEASADHVMAHFWAGDGTGFEVSTERHQGKSHYAFVDGHVELLPVEAVFAPAEGIDRWHPEGAR
ncbi:MAG: prepilin-type N-terminal cleavage/methylation domain-containing protein [Puniceicoccales bacterium]